MSMKHRRALRLQGESRPLRAIAFDLDSTITRPYLDFTRLRKQLNLPEGDILQWLDGLSPQERFRAAQIIDAFEQDGVENVTWNDGAQETVTAVRNMGLPMAIVTRNSRASLLAVCKRLDVAVDQLVAREDAPPKPHPASLHYTAERLTVPIDQLLMVGDYRHDTDAGRAAGAMTALLTNGKTPTWNVTADLVIERLLDLLAHIE
jgi:HAD superfamily hydrolase (TIGR01509 family)